MLVDGPPERRWGGKERVDDEDHARERLVNAAEVCFERMGLRRTTIDDIARQAKVSRSTVYRYFDGRGDLIAAALRREREELQGRVQAQMGKPGPFAQRLVKATLQAIDAIKAARYLPLMLTPEGPRMAPNGAGGPPALSESLRVTVQPYFEEAQVNGEVRSDITIDDLIGWVVRVVLSFATYDDVTAGGRRRSIRRLLEVFLVPSIESPA